MVEEDEFGDWSFVTDPYKPTYNYDNQFKSFFVGAKLTLPGSAYIDGDSVQMRVPGVLNGRPIETWKPFTIRGKPKYDPNLKTWTYQLDKDGAHYSGDAYFPEKRLKVLVSSPA